MQEWDTQVISEKRRSASEPEHYDFVIFGGFGWIGGLLYDLLLSQGESVIRSKVRLENREEVEKELDKYTPLYVINTAGKTGRPNVDWCESHKIETLRSNVLGVVTLVDVCFQKNIPVTNFASGCIYSGPVEKEFTEEDEPNFTGSFYSFTKVEAEKLLKHYPNLLNLRLRMPISSDLNPRCFVKKITTYEKICSMPNSMSVLSDLLPVALDMTRRGERGTYNFCNPGVIDHNTILGLYKEHVDPEFTWKNFSLEEQSQVIAAPRSNCSLSTKKLEKDYIVPDIKTSLIKTFSSMKKKNL
ncbi:Putative NAD dependent epimerase/dehydratase [Brazilian cedratvirus IHUMI]|uniref:NAD dependent epimerase/dehydratase n=1 Tax=Brazilian cedratvirus IHUMI TaxID=2126980 RepID=A0A2R8FDC4_9VIRU|nr:Putative NAD dependent epimerase/dehydratase [Brazilian cedratvirus IHUMI]